MQEINHVQLHTDPYAITAFIGYLLLVIGNGIYSTRFSSAVISWIFIRKLL